MNIMTPTLPVLILSVVLFLLSIGSAFGADEVGFIDPYDINP